MTSKWAFKRTWEEFGKKHNNTCLVQLAIQKVSIWIVEMAQWIYCYSENMRTWGQIHRAHLKAWHGSITSVLVVQKVRSWRLTLQEAQQKQKATGSLTAFKKVQKNFSVSTPGLHRSSGGRSPAHRHNMLHKHTEVEPRILISSTVMPNQTNMIELYIWIGQDTESTEI